MNKVIFTGRTTKDVELLTTKSGDKIAKFTLAVDRIGKANDDGEQMADFFRCIAFRNAETIANYVGKGSLIMIEGSITVDNVEDEENETWKTYVNVAANHVEYLSLKEPAKSGGKKKQGGNKK